MQRGRGNPNRGAPSKEVYAQQIGIKFKAWRTLFSQEQFLGTVTQIPAVKEELLQQWFQQRIEETGEDQFETGWYDFFRVKREVEAKEASIDQDFYKSFLAWLLGKGKPSDHDKTPWGREAHALQLPEVRALMDAFLDEIAVVENAIAKLLFRGPQTLNEYFLYYKYILQHDRYLLVGDPWFFLEWKRYAGKPDKNGREYRMGEDGKPILDDQNWIEIRNVFAETGERQVAVLERIRQELSDFQSVTNQRLVDERKAMIAELKLNQNTAAKERVEMGLSEDEDDVDAWLSAMENNTEAMKELAKSLNAKATAEQPFGIPAIEEGEVEAQAEMLVSAGVDLDALMEQATDEFTDKVKALGEEKKINPIAPPVLVKVYQLMKAIESQYSDKSRVPPWVKIAMNQAVQLTTTPTSIQGSLEIENLWARVQAAIVRRQAQKHIVVEPQLLPPELDLAQLDNPPTLEGRAITPPPEPATGDHPPNSSEIVNKIRQELSPQEQQQTESTREAVAIQARRRFGIAYPGDKYPEHEQFVQDAERLAAMAQSVNISPERLREPTSLAIDDVIEGIMKGDRGRANQGLEELRQYVIQARKTTQK